jgi:DNA-directed RNA polymerase
LGTTGLNWLKIHLANTFGMNKLSFDQRIAWANDNMSSIIESAANPLGTKTNDAGRWWLKGEDHWQALAACKEIAAATAYKKDKGSEANYMCRLPVQMDGSCNGLQHYAALGRDERGGKAVNLTPDSGVPADVYTDVLHVVKQRVGVDNAKGHEMAKLVHGHLTRKVVKQTVMTSVYGVTFIGARDQIAARLAETDIKWPEVDGQSPDHARGQAAAYLAKLTLDSIGDVFTVGKQIMTWLKMCSMQLSLRGHPTSWITPLGLPIVQPYRKQHQFTIRTASQSITLSESHDALPLDVDRQKDALPPNFVHSLDATHMFMTARTCMYVIVSSPSFIVFMFDCLPF